MNLFAVSFFGHREVDDPFVIERKRLKYSRLAVWYHFSDFDEPHSSLK